MTHSLYDEIGVGYSAYRRPDERIAARINAALGVSRTVLNVGAGAGSYEPVNRSVIAVEPSTEMLRQRSRTAARSIRASADHLPFRGGSLDAALAILTIHHWSRWQQGLAEMKRVARDRVVVLTWDPRHAGFWLVQDYFSEILEIDRAIFPSMDEIEKVIGPAEVQVVPVPDDCADGFLGAYWRRPRAYLDSGVRGAISTFSKLKHTEAGLARLRNDLGDGTWRNRYGSLLTQSELDVGYRLIIARHGLACEPLAARCDRRTAQSEGWPSGG